MSKNKKDFFQQMKYKKIDDIHKSLKISEIVVYCLLLAVLILIELIAFKVFPLSNVMIVLIIIFFILFMATFVCYTVCIFNKNAYHFRNGDMGSGIKNYIACGVVVYIILLILYFSIDEPDTRNFISSLFVPVTTVLAAILAIMGVHYTHIKQQKNIIDKNNLVFIDKCDNVDYEILLNKISNNFNIVLYNASENYGYFCGAYKTNGDEIFEIGDGFNYQPILPKTAYKLKNIPYFNLDEEVFLVYKDISDNFYYIALVQTDNKTLKIKNIDKCDIDFINARIDETSRMYKNSKNITTYEEVSLEETKDDFKIKQRKEDTKPIKTTLIDGYELVVDNNGEILTDTMLLTKLKKERARIAKESKIKPYMVFNNQQLVAIATHKPKNKEEFVSIYGLGERKYKIYGKEIIEKFIINEKWTQFN